MNRIRKIQIKNNHYNSHHSLVGGFSFSTAYLLRLLFSSTTNSQIHKTYFTQPSTHDRLHTTDYTQSTTHHRLHTTDYTQPTTLHTQWAAPHPPDAPQTAAAAATVGQMAAIGGKPSTDMSGILIFRIPFIPPQMTVITMVLLI